ncbi:hypothetical protein [Pseudoalteromonas rubra]|uniref:hypothetical protein n=1 Tax=Pseudoalteromonas rubra TaxID=43658 RepID=UPI002DBB2C10|nr:hypothetical protein [Pseudoalteromonas rubra]MEC4091149.1 hypothetical protein [Pseudoalteromonas rubra]
MRLAPLSELTCVREAAGSEDDYNAIRLEVERGRAALVEHAGCYCVLRLDPDGLCVVCAQGRSLLRIAPHIVKVARRLSAPSIVYHTQRPALARHLSAYNFNLEMTDEYGYQVYRMVLHG